MLCEAHDVRGQELPPLGVDPEPVLGQQGKSPTHTETRGARDAQRITEFLMHPALPEIYVRTGVAGVWSTCRTEAWKH